MKRLINYTIFCILLFFCSPVLHADLVLKVSSYLNGDPLQLDSLKIKNLDNGYTLKFSSMPINDTYTVNLSTETLTGGSDLDFLVSDNELSVLVNRRGELVFNSPLTENHVLAVFDMAGRKVKTFTDCYGGKANYTLHLPLNNLYIVTIQNSKEVHAVKCFGSPEKSVFSLTLTDGVAMGFHTKSAMVSSFQVGSNVEITAYKTDMYSEPFTAILTQTNNIELSFSEGKTLIGDIDGNEYLAIKIGEQWWMAENLRTTRYSNGDNIPFVTDNAIWAAMWAANNYWGCCWYENGVINNSKYGALYSFGAAVKGVSHNGTDHVQGACPSGWHVPSDNEWMELEQFLGMSEGDAIATGDRGADVFVGKKMMSDNGWYSGGNGSNESGFNGKPGGMRGAGTGEFYQVTYAGYWWTSSQAANTHSYYRKLYHHYNTIQRFYIEKSNGFSVRCVR